MLQQTQVVKVIPYYQSFVGRYADILTLARGLSTGPIDRRKAA